MHFKIKTAREFFDFLPGIWQINRKVISHHAHDLNFKAEGYGAFIPSNNEPDLILYSEKVNINNSEKSNVSIIGKQKYEYKYKLLKYINTLVMGNCFIKLIFL